MKEIDLSNRLAALYDRRALQGYVRWKVRTDPAYAAALEGLRGHEFPLVDLGCGVGKVVVAAALTTSARR